MAVKHLCVVITCEHGGNSIPKQFTGLFRNSRKLLASHRGHDPGAIDLTKKLSHELKTQLYYPESADSSLTYSHLGIELEVNRKFPSGDHNTWLDLQQLILESLDRTRCLRWPR